MTLRLDPRWHRHLEELPPLTLDLHGYWALPRPVQRQVEDWLADNGISLRGVFQIGLREGYVEIGRYSANDEGRFWLSDREHLTIAVEWFCFPVDTLPPPEAFR